MPFYARVRAVDVDLLKHGEGGAILAREGEDLVGRARLLATKLVAREGENRELVGRVALRERHHALVVRVRQTSLGGHVDNQRDLTLVFAQLYHVIGLQVTSREIVGGHLRSDDIGGRNTPRERRRPTHRKRGAEGKGGQHFVCFFLSASTIELRMSAKALEGDLPRV